MQNRTRNTLLGVAAAGLVAVGAVGCEAGEKLSEPYRDAPRSSYHNSGPADVITMPDGFSNIATKCDRGTRVYVVFKGDNLYGAITAVPNDPTCKVQP